MSNSKNFSLIVPAAADKLEFTGLMPPIFAPDKDGILFCVKAIMGLNLDIFDKVYFTVLRKHVEAYDYIDKVLELQFRRLGLDKAEIVVLDEPTKAQAETLAKTITAKNIHGAIFIKDADGYFKAEVYPENSVAVYPLESLDIVDPRNKSYVAVDDMQHITNIIEKHVVSNLFNAGGYCFENVDNFMGTFNTIRGLGQIYLSHIIYSQLLENHTFRPIRVTDYCDWNIK